MKGSRTLSSKSKQNAGKFVLASSLLGLLCASGCASSPAAVSLAPAAPPITASPVATVQAIVAPTAATPTVPQAQPAQSASAAQTDSSPAVEKNRQSKVTQASESEIALMRVEIISLKEKMASLQRKLDLVLKAQRSGLYEADNAEQIRSAVSRAETKKNLVPALGSAGPLDHFENEFEKMDQSKLLTPEGPQKIVDRSVAYLSQGEYARVAQTLADFQQRFPNNPLSNTAELTLAEAYVEMSSPQQALPHLRAFYLQHPNDSQMYRAKWLEARVQEQLQAPQKAGQLYREAIALSPQSDIALRARASLEKLNGGAAQ
jgi:tetratricopeptide (TPR) repeat protein